MDKFQFNLFGEGGGCEGGLRPLSQVCVCLCVNVFNTTNRAQGDDRHSVSQPPAEREGMQEAVGVFQRFVAALMPATL